MQYKCNHCLKYFDTEKQAKYCERIHKSAIEYYRILERSLHKGYGFHGFGYAEYLKIEDISTTDKRNNTLYYKEVSAEEYYEGRAKG